MDLSTQVWQEHGDLGGLILCAGSLSDDDVGQDSSLEIAIKSLPLESVQDWLHGSLLDSSSKDLHDLLLVLGDLLLALAVVLVLRELVRRLVS